MLNTAEPQPGLEEGHRRAGERCEGLELDGVIVVEPADIVEANDRGLRSLFVALTRSTQRLSVAHSRPLPASMA